MILATESSIRNELRRKSTKPAAKPAAAVTLQIGTPSGSYSQMVEFKPLANGTVQITTRTWDEFPGGVGPWHRETLPVAAARDKYRWMARNGYSRW